MSEEALNLVAPGVEFDRRRSRRIAVMIPVEAEVGGRRNLARIVELSRTGARLQVPGPKAVGDAVLLRRGELELKAEVVWADRDFAGLRFREPMDECAFLHLRRSTKGPRASKGLSANLR